MRKTNVFTPLKMSVMYEIVHGLHLTKGNQSFCGIGNLIVSYKLSLKLVGFREREINVKFHPLCFKTGKIIIPP